MQVRFWFKVIEIQKSYLKWLFSHTPHTMELLHRCSREIPGEDPSFKRAHITKFTVQVGEQTTDNKRCYNFISEQLTRFYLSPSMILLPDISSILRVSDSSDCVSS